MRVLGVDPGTTATGYGVVDSDPGGGFRLVECGVIRPTRGAPLATRLRELHEDLVALLDRHRPDLLAVEEAFHAKHPRTTLVLGHARGVILLAGAAAGVSIAEFSPAVIKKTVTGKGAAQKPQVAYMVAQLLRLKEAPKPADAADGVAVALTAHLGARRSTLGRGTPAARRRP